MKRFSATKEINNQRERMAMDVAWWDELERLADADDVKGFYAAYAEYLEGCNDISDRRKLLIRMAKRLS